MESKQNWKFNKDSERIGEQDGLDESYYENGQLKKKLNWKDGEREGLFEEYHDNGQLKSRMNFIEGREQGPWENYNKKGKQIK